MSQPLPPQNAPVLTGRGLFSTPWFLYLSQFAQQPGGIVSITPTGSPFTYTASQAGSLSVQGGTVSAITFKRGTTTVTLGFTNGSAAMVNNDQVTITYSLAPTVNFIPG